MWLKSSIASTGNVMTFKHCRLTCFARPDKTNLLNRAPKPPAMRKYDLLNSSFAALMKLISCPKTNYRYKETLADERTCALMDDVGLRKYNFCPNWQQRSVCSSWWVCYRVLWLLSMPLNRQLTHVEHLHTCILTHAQIVYSVNVVVNVLMDVCSMV